MAIVEITKLGFARKRLIDIKNEIDANVTNRLGAVNTNADSVIGQYNGAISDAIDVILEALEDAYFSMYPASASGISLDGAVSFVGMERIAATYTEVIAACYGAEGTLIPVGSIAQTTNNKDYTSQVDTVISQTSMCDGDVKVEKVASGKIYQLTFGGEIASYTAMAGDDSATVATALAADFIASSHVIAFANGDTVTLQSSNKQSGLTLTVSDGLTITRLGTPVYFRADDIGVNALPIGALTKMVTSIAGWDSINNIASANAGTNAETDDQLRARHAIGVRAIGNATQAAIRARLLQEVDGVTSASVYENRSNAATPEGMPAHSIECIVQGGLDLAVAQKIFNAKAAGIETYGNVSQYVKDENGDNQLTRFSRPVSRFAWVKVTGARYAEESLPTEYKYAIIAAVVKYGNSLGVGADIITQRFYGEIYDAVSGIASMVIQVAVTDSASGTPTYGTDNIPISRSEISVFAAVRVTVEDFT